MESKYYTPDLEEFHIGFEYQYKSFSNWSNHTLKDFWLCDNDGCIEDYVLTQQTLNSFRVKYLDQQDIESLGWKGNESNTVYFKKDNYRLVHWITKEGRDISIYENYDGGLEEETLIRSSKIKNKSELRKLMKQLRINE